MAAALKAVPNNVDWHWWVKIGAALFDALADDGENLFITWSAQSPNDDREYTRRKWHSFRTSTMTTTTASLFWLARQNGWQPASERGIKRHSERKRRAMLSGCCVPAFRAPSYWRGCMSRTTSGRRLFPAMP